MTQNQIEYAKLLETRRSNQQQEALTKWRDSTTARLGFQNLEESRRHNLATEQHAVSSLDETKRSNLEKERISQHQADTQRMSQEETKRANLVKEQLSLRQQAEAERYNRAQEVLTAQRQQEQARANRMNEQLTAQATAQRREQAHLNYQASVLATQETKRNNIENLALQESHYAATESVAKREAAVKEAQLVINQQIADESERHNQRLETEQERHARVGEAQKWVDTVIGVSEGIANRANSTRNALIQAGGRILGGQIGRRIKDEKQ